MLPEYIDIPIVPLPNVTFFPQTFLPLHVFEPRYRTMTSNCLAGDRLMGVSLLKEGWQKDYFGRPPICKTFGIGKIINSERQEDGCYNIVLEGVFRARTIEEFPTQPYRTARASVLQDAPIDGRRAQVGEMMKALRTLTAQLTRRLPQLKETVASAFAAHPHPLVVANQLASALVIDAYDRQSILEQDDPLRRLQLLLIQVRNLIHQLSDQVHEGIVGEE